MASNNEYIPIPHIGQILNEEFLEPLGITQNALANAIGVPTNRINAIVRGRRRITADADLRLTKYFDLSKGYFLRFQSNLELMEQSRVNFIVSDSSKMGIFKLIPEFNIGVIFISGLAFIIGFWRNLLFFHQNL